MCRGDRQNPQKPADRFDKTGQRRDRKGVSLAVTYGRQGQSQTFGHILPPDPNRQCDSVIDVAAAEPDADGKALWEVVKRNRDDEQPDSLGAFRRGALPAEDKMLVRRIAMHEPQARGPPAECRISPEARILWRHCPGCGQPHPGDDERKERGGQHHSGSEAEHHILGLFRHSSRNEHRKRTEPRRKPCHEAGQSAWKDRRAR